MKFDQEPITVHPIGEAADLGVWAITVAEVVAGDEAASFLTETNPENPPAPDGQVYVCARITAQNTSDQTRSIQMVDFAGTGSDGILRRTQAVVIPEPILQAVIEPGAFTEGWITITVDDPAVAVLLFDSPILGGNWPDGAFALAAGASLAAVEELDASDTDTGSDPASPAAPGETVTVGGWEVTVDRIIHGTEIFDIADFRYTALGKGADSVWVHKGVGVYLTVRNLNPFPAFFSDIALELADFNGEPWDHTLTMTGPEPDVSREYLPGASGEGWATFGGWAYTENQLIKVQPFKIGGEARYFSFDGTAPPPQEEEDESTTEEAATESKALAVGDLVKTTEDLVNLRQEPAASGKIVMELPLGTELEITAEPTDADNYTWFGVQVVESDESGFVVQDFIDLA